MTMADAPPGEADPLVRPDPGTRRSFPERFSHLFSSTSSRSGAGAVGRRRSLSRVVLAPDDASLPRGTKLYGSSRFAANAYSSELRSLRASNPEAVAEDSDSDDDEDEEGGGGGDGARDALTLDEIRAKYQYKARTTFLHDAATFAAGTIPQSIVLAVVIGVVCGLLAYAYYAVLEYLLEVVWKKMPERFVSDRWPEELYVLWIPLCTFAMSLLCGLSVYYLGEPGDLAYTIQAIHEKGYKATSHIVPMVAASQCTILAGASLGPEAPLVVICAATAGWISRTIFKQRDRNVVRKHTFMGMAGALAAFFGVPLGGSMFAIEVTSRFGLEYFEHLVEAIFAGEVCLAVFRQVAGLSSRPIWEIVAPSPSLLASEPYEILLGGCLGLVGAGIAWAWAHFHWRLMDVFGRWGLIDDENEFAVRRALVAAVPIAGIGVLVPHTMFWGEWEFGTIATLSPAKDLVHVWPTSGLLGFEMDGPGRCLVVGCCKLVAISFTVAGGYRGGYIFPFFSAGAAFGRALCFALPGLSPVIATLCVAAGINVGITRTALATSLILAFLSGEQMAMPAVLSASIVSLFATGYMPFIKSQIARSDIDFSLYYQSGRQPKIRESFRASLGKVPGEEGTGASWHASKIRESFRFSTGKERAEEGVGT
ncbi:hypothetical protein ACHAWF_003298 [Thalassiosira exigua]